MKTFVFNYIARHVERRQRQIRVGGHSSGQPLNEITAQSAYVNILVRNGQLSECLSLTHCFNGHFPRGPGLAGTGMEKCLLSGFYWS